MPKKYLQLEDTRVYYDRDSGAIRLISKDPRLKGSPFQLNLLRDSEDTESIYGLLEAEGLIGNSPNVLPETARLPSPYPQSWKLTSEDERMPNRDVEGRNLRFLVGESYENRFLEINLHHAPNTLISGHAGTGKSVLLGSLLDQILERPEIILFHVNSRHPEELGHIEGKLRSGDLVASDTSSGIDLIRNTVDEMARRYRALEERGVNSWLSLGREARPLILALDSFSDLSSSPIHGSEVQEMVQTIARLGRAAGVYLLMTSKEIDSPYFTGELKANFGRRILLRGFDDRRYQELALGSSINYGQRKLDSLGRAALRIYGSRIRIFQSFSPAGF